jgi:hypothetical protein
LHESAAYIAGRIGIAGGEPGRIFSREAVVAIHERSRGIPRTISVICDNALLTGYAEEQQPISAKLIVAVCQDFDLQGLPRTGRGRAQGRVPRAAEPIRSRAASSEGGVPQDEDDASVPPLGWDAKRRSS